MLQQQNIQQYENQGRLLSGLALWQGSLVLDDQIFQAFSREIQC